MSLYKLFVRRVEGIAQLWTLAGLWVSMVPTRATGRCLFGRTFPLGPILAVPLTLFCKSVLFDADPRTRWLSVFMGGSLDNLVTGEEVPPVQAPAVVEDDEIEPDPDIEHRLDGKPEAPGAVVETEDEADVAEDDRRS